MDFAKLILCKETKQKSVSGLQIRRFKLLLYSFGILVLYYKDNSIQAIKTYKNN